MAAGGLKKTLVVYGSVFAAGFAACLFLAHPKPVERVLIRNVTALSSHESSIFDSTSSRTRVRAIDVTAPVARSGKTFGEKLDATVCPKINFHFRAVDSSGYVDVWLYGLNCYFGSIDSSYLVPSHRSTFVVDTVVRTIYRDRDTKTSSFTSTDSSVQIITNKSAYRVAASLLSPVLHDGLFGYAPLETRFSVEAAAHILPTLDVMLSPEILLLAPSLRSTRINAGISFTILGQ